jgi:hypothetical protein
MSMSPFTLAALCGAALAQAPSEPLDLSQLHEDEAYRLLYVAPSGAPWPEGTIIQWEAHRGQLRVYITNRRSEPLYLDWSKSYFVDTAARSWPLRSASETWPTRDTVQPGTPYEASLALVDGPEQLYTPADVGRELSLSLSLGTSSGGFVPYSERFTVDMDMAQAAHSIWAEEKRDLEVQVRRSIWSTTFGALIAGGGVFLLVDQNLSIRDGEVDDQLQATRLASGGGALGLGMTMVTASSIRRASSHRKLAALETRAPLE